MVYTTATAGDDEHGTGEGFARAVGAAFQQQGHATVLVIGPTGAGKSSLINTFFVGNPAPEGCGRPVTGETTCYDTQNGLLTIYDTKGVEFGLSRQRIKRWLDAEVRTTKFDVAWFCVRATDRRVDNSQLELIRALTAHEIPVIVVLTQTHRTPDGLINPETVDFIDAVAWELRQAGARAIVPVATRISLATPTVHGLDELLRQTGRVLPPESQRAFDAVQAVDWAAKKRHARAVVGAAAGSAMAAAAVPVPLVDTGIVPIQLGMLASITAIYGIPANVKQIVAIASPIIVGRGVVFAGRTLFKALVKSVPGANVAVGVAAAAVAGTVTYALGEAWIQVCELLTKLADRLDRVDVESMREEFLRAYHTRQALGELPRAA